MKLLWCSYKKESGKPAKHYLYLDLGKDSDKQYALAAKSMNKEDIATIRKHASKLDLLTTDDKIKWIKIACPGAMDNFRTLKLSKLRILKEYNIKSV